MMMWIAKVMPIEQKEHSYVFGVFLMNNRQRAFEQFIAGHKEAKYWEVHKHDDLFYTLKGFLVRTDHEHLFQLDITAWKVQ